VRGGDLARVEDGAACCGVGRGSGWRVHMVHSCNTAVFCASRATWLSTASGKFASCGARAGFHLALRWRWWRVRDDGEEVT